MKKKDYIAIAKILKDVKDPLKVAEGYESTYMARLFAVKDMADQLADYFTSDNPKFDRGKWFLYINS